MVWLWQCARALWLLMLTRGLRVVGGGLTHPRVPWLIRDGPQAFPSPLRDKSLLVACGDWQAGTALSLSLLEPGSHASRAPGHSVCSLVLLKSSFPLSRDQGPVAGALPVLWWLQLLSSGWGRSEQSGMVV